MGKDQMVKTTEEIKMSDDKKKRGKSLKKKLTYNELYLEHYKELCAKEEEVKRDKKPLEKYLKSIGLLPQEVKSK